VSSRKNFGCYALQEVGNNEWTKLKSAAILCLEEINDFASGGASGKIMDT